MFDEITIPGGQARATRVENCRLLEIVNVRGRRVCDLVAFGAEDLDEHLSPAHTRSMLDRLTVRVSGLLHTNARNPIFEIVEDTVGCHDLLMAARGHRRYKSDYDLKDHRSCRANFTRVLGGCGIGYLRIPDPVNLFQKTTVAADGSLRMEVSPTTADARGADGRYRRVLGLPPGPESPQRLGAERATSD